jgi:diguanylate cyclase (GGDEF)-like protein
MLRCLPWLAAGVLAYSFLFLLGDWPTTGDLLALALVPAVVGSALLVPWERLPMWMQTIPLLLPFVAVALVRSSHESVTATYTPVVLLPVIWFAFYGTRRQLMFSLVCLGVTLAIPSPAFDGYPALEPIAALFWMGVAAIMGFSVNELVLERERLLARLGRMARTDALTGLPNRRAWDEALDRELARAGRGRSPVCAALLDLDHFKQFNDLNGHPAGDGHLKEAASLWRSRLRSADLIARYGGEEFAVLLTETDLEQARQVVETLRACVPREETVSAGIAQWDGAESGTELFARADRALYEAKRLGRDRTVEAGGAALMPA